MNRVTRALTAEEIARVEARTTKQNYVGEEQKASPTFVSNDDNARKITIPLEFPVKYEGVTYEEITVQRPILKVWKQYLLDCAEAVQKYGLGADDDIDQPWVSAPAWVINHLDFVDGSRVEAAQEGFFAALPSSQAVEEARLSNSMPDITGENSPSG
ncbi:hypothetical protein K1X45_01940 [Pseudochrobactrum sp. Wa41.01b-1]|uniref:hypothetical protein n=1 Tax=Pseudochrobactrum sp. Wa41.01b-1 TaxID=2864102 RepID=UPI001C693E3E|nr:hypothetical protein [Pseudochrobactrum sp. Wa41.01b-1]QYM73233.1 hypothetical protein K1X45_01940 [Pseudochrobactrum sp. Wa41.01b-1]